MAMVCLIAHVFCDRVISASVLEHADKAKLAPCRVGAVTANRLEQKLSLFVSMLTKQGCYHLVLER